MLKRIETLIFLLIFVMFLGQSELKTWSLSSSINIEYFTDSAIHVVEDNHEEDNIYTDNNPFYNSTLQKNLSGKISYCTLTGISGLVWQPPELQAHFSGDYM